MDRHRLGLSGDAFAHFFRDVERGILDYPWLYSGEVPESGGALMRPTRDAFGDVPPLYVFYKVNREENRVRFIGLAPAWSSLDLVPEWE